MNKKQREIAKVFDYYIKQRHCRIDPKSRMQLRDMCATCQKSYRSKEFLEKIKRQVIGLI